MGFENDVQRLALGTGVIDDFHGQERAVEGRNLDLHLFDHDLSAGDGDRLPGVAGLPGRLAGALRLAEVFLDALAFEDEDWLDALDAFFDAEAGSA